MLVQTDVYALAHLSEELTKYGETVLLTCGGGSIKKFCKFFSKNFLFRLIYAITNPIYHLKSFFITKIFQISEITSFFMVES